MLDGVYEVLIEQVHQNFGGNVVTFGGDAITCFFDDRLACLRPVRCGRRGRLLRCIAPDCVSAPRQRSSLDAIAPCGG